MKKIIYLLIGLCSVLGLQAQNFGSPAMRKLQLAEFAISNLYVDTVNENKLVESAIIEMLAQLDPHSTYSDAEEVKKMNEPLQGNFEGIGVQFQMIEDTLAMAPRIVPKIRDISHILNTKMKEGEQFLYEGAQGTMLDIDHGTYPFVTSSNTVAGFASPGSGVGPQKLNYILGITKAYCTRVGSGPFPTELFDEVGKTIAKKGNEFGAVTGRPRRCGWFDGAALRRAVEWNGLSGLAVMKLDVLDGFETVRLGVGYEYKGERIDIMPVGAEEVAQCKVIYEDFPGWKEPTFGITKWEDLPVNAQKYLTRLSEVAGCPIAVVSTGPDRAQTILLHNPFE